MSLEISPSRSASASPPLWVNSELETYPPNPLPLIREGGIMVSEGADAPSGFPFTISYQKDVQEGLCPSLKPLPPLQEYTSILWRGDEGGEVHR
jgi:hypothetical protein